ARVVQAEDLPLGLFSELRIPESPPPPAATGKFSGIWNRHSASICHCGEPYQTESDPKRTRSSPKNFRPWPRMCAQPQGKVMTDDANVVPSSATTFVRFAQSCRHRL